jgi:hypothetical protein
MLIPGLFNKADIMHFSHNISLMMSVNMIAACRRSLVAGNDYIKK